MEAEKADDPFELIIEFCQPTASQAVKFSNCPLARESEIFVDSYPDQFSSSPDPTPSDPTQIVMVSPPGSSSPVQQHVEEEAVFHTPPEHHVRSHLSSSEDQNPNELCAGAVDGPDRRNKVRVSEAGVDDEPVAKKIRAMEEKFQVEAVPADETEVITLEREDSCDEITNVNFDEDSLDIISGGRQVKVDKKIDGLMKDGVPKVLAVTRNHDLGAKWKSLEDNRVNKGETSCEDSDLSGSLDSVKIDEEIVMLKRIVGNRCIEVEQNSGVGGSEKVIKITKDAKMPKDYYMNQGLETDGKIIQEIGLKTDDKIIQQETDCKRTEEICLKTDGKKIEREPDCKRIEEIHMKTDDKSSEVISSKASGNRFEDIVQAADVKRTEEIGLEKDGKRREEIGLDTEGKRREEIGLDADGKRRGEVGLETNGKRTEETGLETDGKRIEEIGLEKDGKNVEEIGLENDGKRREEIGLEKDGKNVEEFGLETDGKRAEETGKGTDGKRKQEISLESNGKKKQKVGLITAGERSEEIALKKNGKRIEDIDGFRYTCGDDKTWKGRRCHMPVSLKGKEEEVVKTTETKGGLLDAVKDVVGDTDGACEDMDFFEILKRMGMTFPRPRWWPPEGFDKRRTS